MIRSKQFAAVIVFSTAGLLPLKAFCESIPFYVSNDTDKKWYVCCRGPWGRTASTTNVAANEQNLKFYSAETTLFSVFGKWTCPVTETEGIIDCGTLGTIGDAPQCDEKGVDCINFCLENIPNAEVDLTINDGSKTVNFDKDCDSTVTQAFMGDGGSGPALSRDAKRLNGMLGKKADRDTFSFEGTEGDDVKITLERHPERGHAGEQATLILQDDIEEVSLFKTETDSLPNEITAVLPASGNYKIIVQQAGIPSDVRFRGDYFLRIESEMGGIQEIRPSDDVEN